MRSQTYRLFKMAAAFVLSDDLITGAESAPPNLCASVSYTY
jgi:hypothetical protein